MRVLGVLLLAVPAAAFLAPMAPLRAPVYAPARRQMGLRMSLDDLEQQLGLGGAAKAAKKAAKQAEREANKATKDVNKEVEKAVKAPSKKVARDVKKAKEEAVKAAPPKARKEVKQALNDPAKKVQKDVKNAAAAVPASGKAATAAGGLALFGAPSAALIFGRSFLMQNKKKRDAAELAKQAMSKATKNPKAGLATGDVPGALIAVGALAFGVGGIALQALSPGGMEGVGLPAGPSLPGVSLPSVSLPKLPSLIPESKSPIPQISQKKVEPKDVRRKMALEKAKGKPGLDLKSVFEEGGNAPARIGSVQERDAKDASKAVLRIQKGAESAVQSGGADAKAQAEAADKAAKEQAASAAKEAKAQAEAADKAAKDKAADLAAETKAKAEAADKAAKDKAADLAAETKAKAEAADKAAKDKAADLAAEAKKKAESEAKLVAEKGAKEAAEKAAADAKAATEKAAAETKAAAEKAAAETKAAAKKAADEAKNQLPEPKAPTSGDLAKPARPAPEPKVNPKDEKIPFGEEPKPNVAKSTSDEPATPQSGGGGRVLEPDTVSPETLEFLKTLKK